MSKKFARLPRHLTLDGLREIIRERRAKEKFKSLLKHGKPTLNTRPPYRLVPRVPRQFDSGGLDD